ncbi:MAG: 5'/3'-nucleotidase SurE, partial [Thermoanaerobaculia bacterium]
MRFRELFVASLLALVSSVSVADPEGVWPRRVLLTNDDGVREGRLHALAEAFAQTTETWVVASFEDKSGSSNYMRLGKYERTLLVRRLRTQERLSVYAVAGFPADAVLVGVRGLLADTPPDPVVSGVNGGDNLGTDGWWGSGTIGAARAAAFLGIPAIAVSGLDDGDKDMVRRVTRWVVELSRSKAARKLEPGQYLTVAFPQIPASEIRGVRIAPRMPSIVDVSLERLSRLDGEESGDELWTSAGRWASANSASFGIPWRQTMSLRLRAVSWLALLTGACIPAEPPTQTESARSL